MHNALSLCMTIILDSVTVNSFQFTMLSPSRADSTSKPARVKRSLFNKPAWSRTEPVGDAVDIFRRSDQAYADIVAEEEKKRKRKLARKEREWAKQNRDVVERAGKRRRISDYSEDEDDHSSSGTGGEDGKPLEELKKTASVPAESSPTRASAEKADRDGSPKSLLKRYESTVTAANNVQEAKTQAQIVIDLEDKEEEQHFGLAPGLPLDLPQAAPEYLNEAEDFPPSDEEFPELARQAREKARLKRMEKEKEASAVPEYPCMITMNKTFDAPQTSREETVASQPPPPDPKVDILITSQIPNTKPLIVSRKLTQRLKDVRLTWCQRQGFSVEATASIFLTWRGKRLFDVTTCRSMGIGVDTHGNVALKGERDMLRAENRQIHMEAMTEEMMDDYKKGKRNLTGGDAEYKDEEIVEQPKQPAGIKIILRSKDFEDFKLIVKPVRARCCCPLLSHANQCRSLQLYPGS